MNNRRSFFGSLSLFPVEWVVLVFTLLTVVLYSVCGIPFRQPASLYFARITQGAALYFVGLLLILLMTRLTAIRGKSRDDKVHPLETLRAFAADRLTPSRLIHDLRLLNAIALVFVVFIQLKHLTPYLRSTLYDPLLFSSERAVFGGRLAGERLQELLLPEFAEVLSDSYVFFYPYMAVLIFYFVLHSPAVAQKFCTAFSLCWFIGILLIYAVPTWGPCFFQPELYQNLPLTEVTDLQADLWKNKLFLDVNPQSAQGVFLISGFPSLHIAFPLLGTVMAWPLSRALAILSAIFTGITFASTIYFGWHYVVDDLGAVAVVLLALLLPRLLLRSSGQ